MILMDNLENQAIIFWMFVALKPLKYEILDHLATPDYPECR